MSTIGEFFGARPDGDTTVLTLGRELHGAFGGAFGGMLAAAAVHVARPAAGGRRAAGLDCRFLRAMPAGKARASVEVIHEGRSLTCVRVDLRDERGRLATTATVSFVDAARLHALDVDGGPPAVAADLRAWSLPPGVEIPIVATLDPRLGLLGGGAFAVDVRVPWDGPADDPAGDHAEPACIAADFCVGPPVGAAFEGTWLPHPNPDLSVRFAPARVVGARVTGVGRLVRMAGGQAVVGIEVHAGGVRFASGAATSMVLRGGEG